MKSGWEKYATKERLVKKGYFRKHCDGGSGRKAREASCRDSLQQSWKEQEEIEVLLTEVEIIFTGEENVQIKQRSEESGVEAGLNQCRLARRKSRKGKNTKREDEGSHQKES